MAIQINITNEGLAKIRSVMDGGSKITVDRVECIDDDRGGAVVATLPVEPIGSVEQYPDTFRFTVQDKSDAEYVCHRVRVYDTDSVVIAESNRRTVVGGGTADPFFTKHAASEMLVGFELHFEGMTVRDYFEVGDVKFNLDSATEELEGVVELATEAEAKAGTDAKRAITPKTLDAVIQSHGNVVHRAGAEAITGYKSFEGGISKRDVSADVLIIPVNNLYSSLDFSDKNNKKYASVVGAIYNSGEFGAILATNRTIDGKEYHSQISVRLDKDGKAYATAPTPASDDSSTKIATTAWVKAVANKLLSLAGGKMTATKAMSRNVANSFLGLHGGTGDTNDGAQLYLCGADHPEMPSAFQLHARNETVDNILEGTIGGLLKWIDKYVLNNSFQMPTDGGAIMLTAGTSATGGAHFRLYGKSHTSGEGRFDLAATDGTNTKSLTGKPDGTLTWGGKKVVTEDKFKVVDALPANPDANTFYFVVDEGA